MVLVGATESSQMTSVDNPCPPTHRGTALVAGTVGSGGVILWDRHSQRTMSPQVQTCAEGQAASTSPDRQMNHSHRREYKTVICLLTYRDWNSEAILDIRISVGESFIRGGRMSTSQFCSTKLTWFITLYCCKCVNSILPWHNLALKFEWHLLLLGV